jgi:hypothetical protein
MEMKFSSRTIPGLLGPYPVGDEAAVILGLLIICTLMAK